MFLVTPLFHDWGAVNLLVPTDIWPIASPPELMGCEPPNPRTVIANSMISELDTEILTRDGVKLRANIYRPEDRANDRSPVILNYSVYGKDGAVDVCFFPPASGIDRGRISNKYLFEAADPVWWCAQGYAVATVDARGSFQSEGDKSFYSRVVGLDGENSLRLCREPAQSPNR